MCPNFANFDSLFYIATLNVNYFFSFFLEIYRRLQRKNSKIGQHYRCYEYGMLYDSSANRTYTVTRYFESRVHGLDARSLHQTYVRLGEWYVIGRPYRSSRRGGRVGSDQCLMCSWSVWRAGSSPWCLAVDVWRCQAAVHGCTAASQLHHHLLLLLLVVMVTVIGRTDVTHRRSIVRRR